MIAFLEGTVQKIVPDGVIIRTGSIGYAVTLPSNTIAELEESQGISLYIHTAVREDDISLYGFETFEELTLFKKLISVSGVGPKTAVEILNNSAASVRYAITQGDAALLQKTPGIGKKTAQRIILDLKNKVTEKGKPANYVETKTIHKDAVKALEKLGFRKNQIISRLKELPETITEEEDIIRYFLQNA
ncbi:Holliday junction branch migration protein RuvA [Candidatus Peregrinibacteria bacterium]|nr:Holliday junction branch migration protein RuvA [Candidatus Peregrinibacteria bacterium]